ncbi:hypothetical protein SAMN05216496_2696 [Pseudomonas sp. Z003-0.4C(8344-21)]|nr:hypothetical protein SAMN05216496_2696 [Pseudomonas sp. Z003-0.4C(8344-21)]
MSDRMINYRLYKIIALTWIGAECLFISYQKLFNNRA